MQTDEQRKQLLEQQQIARMILSLQECRDSLASQEKENTRLNNLVDNLDRQVANLQRISDEHKKAADDYLTAIQLHKQAEAVYKTSLEDARKEIAKLEKRVGFWQRLAGIAFLFGVALGFLANRN